MKRVLVANRGEIAVRVIRAAREEGYETVAVYADQDIDSLHVKVADTGVALPGTSAAETYLDQSKILLAAEQSNADAIHPGYGFLSENGEFAQAVQASGRTWIGPNPSTIEQLGDKVSARALAKSVGAPLLAGSDGPIESAEEVHRFAEIHGLPVVIKAAHGGGGRGMRVVRREADIDESFRSATREASVAFGRDECFVERYLDRPRHVEAQVLADAHGRIAVLGTRDCSIQRRNQKLIEEAPAPLLDSDVSERIQESARAICSKAGYVGAATVEYLLGPDGTLSFLEVNTRLQVEHPVTEEVAGVDIVKEQLRIAEGFRLSLPNSVELRGHAIEFRINAEDPALGFIPTPGRIEEFRLPTGPGIRIDSGVHSGDDVSDEFDSMFAKLIVHGPDRRTTLHRARRALAEMEVIGIPSVLPFHRWAVAHPDFTRTDNPEHFAVHTRWIETILNDDVPVSPFLSQSVNSQESGIHRLTVEVNNRPISIGFPDSLLKLIGTQQRPSQTGDYNEDNREIQLVYAPVGGVLTQWLTEDRTAVESGTPLAVIETMKMETEVVAPSAGIFAHGTITSGEKVARHDVIGRVD